MNWQNTLPNSIKEKTNLLFVAFEFPPLDGAGVQRSLKFVKYLQQFEINPIVITIMEQDGEAVMKGHSLDYSLCADIPENSIIKRIHCEHRSASANKLTQWARIYFSITEEYKQTWKAGLLKELPEIIAEHKPKAIYISLPPFAMAPLWLSILKKCKLPLIADFRDAWSQWCVAPNGSYLHYYFKLLQERKILGRADKIICSSNETMLDIKRVHPSVKKEKFSVITNGYDGGLEWDVLPKLSVKENIKIGYVGSFYYTPESREQIFKPWWKKLPHRMLNYVPRKEDWLYRSPYFFFKAIRYLLDKDQALRNRIEIHFAGHTPAWLREQINSFGLSEVCQHSGYLNHDSVIEFQKSCDALLITSSKVLGGRDYSIAGKTFEYFTIGKPILAFVCEGAQKDILAETGMSVMCNPDDVKESAEMMRQLFTGELILNPDKAAIQKYHRKNLAKKLSDIVKDAIRSDKN